MIAGLRDVLHKQAGSSARWALFTAGWVFPAAAIVARELKEGAWTMVSLPQDAFFPGKTLIDAYGDGGFRFAEMSHRGSILCLPSGVYAWPVLQFEDLSISDFNRVFAEAADIEFVLLGCGDGLLRPPQEIRDAFKENGTGLEPMGTGAAARTYNVLLGERRAVAAALIAVSDPAGSRA